ncbi:MAG: HPr family phosphocarrier protein [Vicinamibacterales bacterium]|nr:HPr family phosphocarrier protein [Vicinamibacterales bacterium]
MLTRSVSITNALGMHARAAARFVHAAGAFQSRVLVSRGGQTVDGKSILGILLLAAARGSDIDLCTDGPDEADALAALCRLVESGFGEGACNA